MSRIGNKPVTIPEKVEIKVEPNNVVTVKGPNGTLTRQFSSEIKINVQDSTITFERSSEDKEDRALHGLTRALVNNMIIGVSEGFTKVLEIVGTGYRAQLQGDTLVVNGGYSHPINMKLPEGITVNCPSQVEIHISGCDKQVVGEFAAEIRKIRKPEPYLGKGIHYRGEYIRRKEGKKAK